MIIYDNIVYILQKAGGISTYWGELSLRLLRDKEDVFFIEGQDDHNTNIVRKSLNIGEVAILKDRNLPKLLNRFLNVKVSESKFKFIFHSSYNRVTLNNKAAKVVTIHDFVHEKYYSGLRKLLHSYQKSKAINSADRIIVVSENTKRDLLEAYPKIDSAIVRVIYNGVSDDFYEIPFQKEVSSERKNKPYIMFIGAREEYKNFDFAIEVISRIKDFDFYIVGGELNSVEFRKLNEKLNGRWKVFNRVSNTELNLIYNNASALLYPSSYEGFGIPLLEAMRTGTPFVALNQSSIPEVAGNAGILLDDLNIEQFMNAILSVEIKREELKNKGRLQVKKFSWEKCYQETMEVYKELLN